MNEFFRDNSFFRTKLINSILCFILKKFWVLPIAPVGKLHPYLEISGVARGYNSRRMQQWSEEYYQPSFENLCRTLESKIDTDDNYWVIW